MPARHDMVPWTNDLELADLRRWTEVDGLTKERAAIALNEKYHKGTDVRSPASVGMMRTRKKWYVAKVPKAHKDVGPQKQQEVEREETPDGITLKSRGSRITTVEALLAYAKVTGVVTKQTVKTWDTTLMEGGESKTIQNFAIHVEVKPNQTSTEEAVKAIIAGAFTKRGKIGKVAITSPKSSSGLMQAVGIFDPHFAKLAWSKETGHGDYDLKIATDTVRAASTHLLDCGNREGIDSRLILLGGDVYHFDTPHGTTTKGTPLERDGRVQKMIEEGSKCLFDVIEWSASKVPTHVIVVPGNHDFVLSWALQRILLSHFRHDKRVTVDNTFTERKYHTYGRCLLGLSHGEKAAKRLPGLMAREAPQFSTARLREWHTGHFHQRKEVNTIEGVLCRQHPSLSPADSWHSAEGFISDRGMDAVIYHKDGFVTATHSYTPP